MDDVLDALEAQHAELAGIIDPLDEQAWQLPSRCAGWSVADVVLHLVQTDELALASLADRIDAAIAELAADGTSVTSVDEGAELAVQRGRGASGAELAARWHTTSGALRAAFADGDPRRRVTWVAGTLSERTLAATRLSEAWIHTGDVGYAFGSVPPPTDRLRHIARLAWRTLPYAFARSGRTLGGPVAFHLRAPSGAAWDFTPDDPPVTTIRGDGVELCLVAARRLDPEVTSLRGDGPDVAAVLDLVRTYA
jgi:uncharacterized protein (TIGR03084 family)